MEKDEQKKKREYRNYLSQTAGLFGVLILLTVGISYITLSSIFETQESQPTLQAQGENSTEQIPLAEVSNNGPIYLDPENNNLFQTLAGDCTVAQNDQGLDPTEQEMAQLINSYRSQNGLSSLPVINSLSRTAAWMVNNMAQTGNLSHTDSLGRNYDVRLKDCGYNPFGVDILAFNANSSASSALTTWKNSPNHNIVILNQVASVGGGTVTKNWQAMGIARAYANGRWWWAAYFGDSNDGSGTPQSVSGPTTAPQPTSPPATCDTAAQLQGHASYQAYCASSNQCMGTPSTSGQQLSCPCVPCSNPTTHPNPTTTIIPTNTPAPNQPTATPIPQATDVRIDLSLALSGIGTNTTVGQNPNPTNQSRQVNLEVLDLNGNKITETSGNLTAQSLTSNQSGLTYGFRGIINLDNVQNGTYNLRVRFENTLWKNLGLATLSNSQIYTSSAQMLTSGDINFDNTIDLIDYNQIFTCINPTQSQVNIASVIICALSDFNLDGKIDERDLNIFYDGLANRHGD